MILPAAMWEECVRDKGEAGNQFGNDCSGPGAMLVAWAGAMAVRTGIGGQGRTAGRPSALHSVSVFLLHNPPGVLGPWTFPGPAGAAHSMLVMWPPSSRPPPCPALGANPSSPRTRAAPVTLLQSPRRQAWPVVPNMPRLLCLHPPALAAVPSAASLGRSSLPFLRWGLPPREDPESPRWRGRHVPWVRDFREGPEGASFLGKFSSDPAPAGVEPADMLSFLTWASGTRIGNGWRAVLNWVLRLQQGSQEGDHN